MEIIDQKKVGTFSQILLWFGAAISITEIITGAMIAPLGLNKGLLAIFIGHLIGGIVLFLAGYLGARSRLASSSSARISFGKYGSYAFSVLNILQLLGWTIVMLANGAIAMNGISSKLFDFSNHVLWCIVLGILIIIWILLKNKELFKVNLLVMFLLLVFSLLLGFIVFKDNQMITASNDTLSFGMAIELNITMSLSWLPLIADYTRKLKRPFSGTIGSVSGYFFGSMLMYIIGLGAALYTETTDISIILLAAGLGVIAFIIIILSTVTTAFLDVFSAGISLTNLNNKFNEKIGAIIICVIAIILACFFSLSQYENFLYLIGSTFAPLFAVLFTDYYLLKKRTINDNLLNIKNIILWLTGFLVYRLLINYNTIIGITIPVMLGVVILSLIINIINRKFKKDS